MKARKRLDTIMMSCREKMQDEVSALLGKTLKLDQFAFGVTDRESLFSEISGKFVLAKIQLEGDLEGEGCLLISVKDAIRIGGTLIMLPESELEAVVAEQDYTEELEDSYGEIANIFCGAMSATFEEQHPKTFRLVRTEQEVVLPAKVDVEDTAPVPPGNYYVATSGLSLGDSELGKLHVLLPAAAFGLVSEETPPGKQQAEQPEQSAVEQQQEAVSESKPAPATPEQPAKPKVDVVKQQKLIDRLLEESFTQVGDDAGGLLGGELKIVSRQHCLLSKEALFDQAGGKLVMARMDVRGEGAGEAFLFSSLKDAVFLGGSLIMLPESELEEAIRQEEFGEDAQDAYGEITNIIAGVYTAIFEEQSRKKLGFVKTGLETVIPTRVDPDNDDVIANQHYYVSSGELVLNGKELGRLQMAFPATLLDLETLGQPEQAPQVAPAGQPSAGEAGETGGQPHTDQGPAMAPSKPKIDVSKQQKTVDKLLEESFTQLGEDTGGLLGGELKVVSRQHRLLDKEGFFDQTEGKLVMARMDVRGQGEGEAFLFSSLKDAVYLGGSLIMLPESELEEAVRQEEFGEDAQDAYGEIANIIAGVYTAIFEEQSRKKLGFVKTELETVVPTRVEPDSDDVIANQHYYVSSGELVLNGKALGRLHMVIPAALLDLEALAEPEQTEPVSGESRPVDSAASQPTAAAEKPADGEGVARLHPEADQSAEILIYTDHPAEGQSIASSLHQDGFSAKVLNYKDPVLAHLSSRTRMVFLVMEQVNEQGFAMAIKLNSSGGGVPLVAAGPAWTRTLVLRAVKYGACDILITPATPGDIQEKIKMNLTRKAA